MARFTRSPRYRWVVLFMGFLGVFGALGFGRFGYSAILPSMQKDLDITSAAAGSLASWNLGGYVVMCAIGGILASRFGPRKIVSIGTVLAAVGMLVTGLAGGMVSASAGRLLTGLGGGMCLVPSVALMSAWFDARRRGLASGIVTSGSALALVIAGPIVPRIIEVGGIHGWRWAWFFFAALTFIVGILTIALQRDRPRDASNAGTKVTCAKVTKVPLGLGGIARSRYAWHIGFIYMMFGFSYMIYFTFFQKRLTADLGFSSQSAGFIFLIMGIASLLCGVIWGTISDRIGRGRAIAVMCLAQAGAAVLFALWPTTAGLIISAAIYGLCSLAVPGIVGAGCGDQFGPVLASASLGFVTIFLGVGQVAGPYSAGKMEDIFGTLTYSYLLAAGVFFIGTVLALFLKETRWASELAQVRARERGGQKRTVEVAENVCSSA
ncbi:MAG: MFS transporter [Actinobacteria bacterium]|nr:MFS transporter [Actinomycetota bacterium]